MFMRLLCRLKRLFPVLLISIIYNGIYAQSKSDSIRLVTIQKYYQSAIQYKDGKTIKQDFEKAFQNFQNAANLGDPQSIYSVGYMLYKGLGCTQDYSKAAALFQQGALQGRDNSMYFLGLCYKNGYGVIQNTDSANYWLKRAELLGYVQAKQEIKLVSGENSNDAAKALVLQIKNAAVPSAAPLNQFTEIKHSIPSIDSIGGIYTGYIIQYDWSGQNVISAQSLNLNIERTSGEDITATWISGKDTIAVTAVLNSASMEFKKTAYKRIDYYNYDSSGIVYDFQQASLNMVQTTDSLFISGNINMFSPQRNEPSKPMLVVLARPIAKQSLSTVTIGPNPFINQFTVNLNLAETATNAVVQLIDNNGRPVYTNRVGTLEAGKYIMPLQPGQISSGIYFLKIAYGNTTKLIKVIKQ